MRDVTAEFSFKRNVTVHPAIEVTPAPAVHLWSRRVTPKPALDNLVQLAEHSGVAQPHMMIAVWVPSKTENVTRGTQLVINLACQRSTGARTSANPSTGNPGAIHIMWTSRRRGEA